MLTFLIALTLVMTATLVMALSRGDEPTPARVRKTGLRIRTSR